jgi:hypothetical protein
MRLRTALGLKSKKIPQGRLLPDTTRSEHVEKKSLIILGDFNHFRPSVWAQATSDFLAPVDGNEIQHFPSGATYFKWSPWSDYEIPHAIRSRLPAEVHIINDTHFRCDKRNVAHHAEVALGYSLAIDPCTFVGNGVRKSRRNAAHDGVVLSFPIHDPSDDFTYERLVNNEDGSAMVRDIRVPVIFDEIPFVYLKFRPKRYRFSNDNCYCEKVETSAALSPAETERCLRFSSSIGLEYGELDVLRDQNDGQIYIVDANNTPMGPPNQLGAEEAADALNIMGDCISRALKMPRRRP